MKSLPEFDSKRSVNLQGPFTSGISRITLQNDMALPLSHYPTTFCNVVK